MMVVGDILFTLVGWLEESHDLLWKHFYLGLPSMVWLKLPELLGSVGELLKNTKMP